MRRIMILGGTTEGRKLAELCAAGGINAYISVTSDYGARLLPASEYITVICKRMDADRMEALFSGYGITHVIDATHPFALEVTENARQVCKKLCIPYFRIVREQEAEAPGVTYFDDLPAIMAYLEKTAGRIFITTGSKEAAAFCRLKDFNDRCVFRVLDVPEVVERIIQMGYQREQVIALRGPFSVEENISQFRAHHVRYLVTKDSGDAGGFPEKRKAADICGMEVLVLRRHREQGYTLEQIYDFLRQDQIETGAGYE